MKNKAVFLVPLAVFIGIALFLFRGLTLDPRLVPSPLVDKPAPEFSLSQLENPDSTISTQTFIGKVSLLNVWATWCVSCRQEHDNLMKLSRQGVPIYGLNYKDNREDAMMWLKRYGSPYLANAFDANGRVGIDWGVYGTPETFVIDQAGIIRYKHVGPITEHDAAEKILPLVKQLQNQR